MNLETIKRLIIVAAASGLTLLAHAEQAPDNTQGHGPAVIDAANGVPIVLIATPSAAGVSHNQYERFNVDAEGVVLNNSATLTQTQLGGWISGNPNLGNGSARLILNEVTSTAPSSLNGYTEVGGQRAEVIIANPNGITCNGCGFINTTRGVLTTGKPELDGNGGLSALTVAGGIIDVGVLGLNASNTDQVDLLARAVTVNGELWANQLNVVTGSNRVDYASLATTPIAAEGAAPQFSLDVAALGGMYANRIRLIGTEAGVGVRQAGELMSASELVLTTAGELTNTGLMTASGPLSVQASSLKNQGPRAAIASWDNIDLSLTDALKNSDSALIYSNGAMTIHAPTVLNESSIIEAETTLNLSADEITNQRSRPPQDSIVTPEAVKEPFYFDWGQLPTPPGFETSRLWFTRSTVTPYFDQATLAPEAQILSGGDMTLTIGKTLLNDSSVIVSGGILNLNGARQNIDSTGTTTAGGATIINRSPPLIETVKDEGTTQAARHDEKCIVEHPWPASGCAISETYWNDNYYFSYNNTTTRRLPTLRALIGADVAIQGAAVSLDNTFSVAPAPIGSTGGVPTNSTTPVPPARPIVLPDNGLYQLHLEPNHRYLYELDPRFATRDGFLSSDYFFNQLGLAPADTLKRLGDGFYEQKLVQEQILQLTGRRRLKEFANNEAQFKALMDAGVALAEEFELKPGMVLSDTQVASLTHDLVWFETKEVKGQQVLVPVVYLARVNEGDLDAYGPIMASNRIDLKLSGDLTNSGTIRAREYTDIEADNVLNQGGTLQGGEYVLVNAQQDIVNHSGSIRGGDVTLNAGRDVINETTTQQLTFTQGNTGTSAGSSRLLGAALGDQSTLTTTLVGNTAELTGNNITVNAGRDVVVSGAKVNAQNDLSLQANQDVVINTITHHEHQAVVFGKRGTLERDQVTQLASTLNVGGDALIQSGRDVRVQSAEITTGGDLSLEAERDVTIEALANTSNFDSQGGQQTHVRHDVVYDLANVQSGGNLTIHVGQDANLSGANLNAGNDITLHAQRDTNISAVVDSHYAYDEVKHDGNFGSSKTVIDEARHESAAGGQLMADGDVLVNVSKTNSGELENQHSRDVNLLSAQVQAGHTVALHADQNVNVDALVLEDRTLHQEKTKSTAGLKKVDQGTVTVSYTPNKSTITAGADATISAGHDVTLTATEVMAKDDAWVMADNDINLFSRDQTSDTQSWREVTRLVSMDTLKGLMHDSIKFFGVSTGHSNLSLNAKKKHEKSKDDLPQVRAKNHFNLVDRQTTHSHDQQHVVSNIQADGDVNVASGRDLQMQGSDVTAGGALTVHAGRDLTLQAMADESSTEAHGKKYDQVHRETKQNLVKLQSGNGTLSVGQDATLIGANVHADQDLALHVGRDTNISAVTDSVYDYQSNTQEGSFGKKTTTIDETRRDTAVGGVLDAGGNVLVNAHSNAQGELITEQSGAVNLLGATLQAEGHVVVAADDGVSASGMAVQSLDYHQTKKSGTLGMSKLDEGSARAQTGLSNASIAAGQSVVLLSGRDIRLVATDVRAHGDINFNAVDALLIAAGDVTTQTQQWAKQSGMFTGGNIYQKTEHRDGERSTTGQASNIMAGGRVQSNTGSARVVGSMIRGDEAVSLITDSGDVDVTTYQAQRESYSKDKEIKVGLGDVGKNLSRPDQWVKNRDGRLTMTVANANYDEVDVKTTTNEHQASVIQSNGDVTLQASAGNVIIAGSQVAADTDGQNGGAVTLQGATGANITDVANTMERQTKTLTGAGEMSIVVQHQAIEIVKAALDVEKAKKKLSDAKHDYRDFQRNLDQLESQLSQLESDYANKAPGVRYDDVLELRELVHDIKGDEDYYQAGIALAAVNVATSIITLVQQIGAAAASTGTWGFNAGVQLDIDATKTHTSELASTAQGSRVTGNQINIETGVRDQSGRLNTQNTNTTIKGSELIAQQSTDDAGQLMSSALGIHTGGLSIQNSRDTYERRDTTEHGHVTAQVTVYGAAGGASISGSFDRNQATYRTSTVNNSVLNADTIALTSDNDMTIQGATVRANDTLNVDVGGNLTVESQQNRSSSRSVGVGVSAGMSFGGKTSQENADAQNAAHAADPSQPAASNNILVRNAHGVNDLTGMNGVNGGVNVSNGMSSTRETVLTSLTSGGTANVNVKDHTQLTGALIGTTDDEGNDLNQLTFTTGSLTTTDLRNTIVSSNTSIGVSSNVNIKGKAPSSDQPSSDQPPSAHGLPADANTAKDAKGKDVLRGSSTINASNSQQNSASKTLATLGHGNITVGGVKLEQDGELTEAGQSPNSTLASLNRDTTNTTKELWNSDYTQTVDASIDHRLLTKDGRKEIKQEIKDLPENMQKMAQNVPAPTGGNAMENAVGKALDKLGDWTLGLVPSNKDAGGMVAQLGTFSTVGDINAGPYQIRGADDPYVLEHPELFMDATTLPYFDMLEAPGKARLDGKMVTRDFINIDAESATYQNHVNGMQNNLPQALVNGLEQTDSTILTEFYNPTHGFLPDLLESGVDKVAGNKYVHTGVAAQTGEFVQDVVQANGTSGSNFTGHSQGTELLNAGLNTLTKSDFLNINFKDRDSIKPTFFINGAPVSATTMQKTVEEHLDFKFSGSNANKNDPVAEVLGGNRGLVIISEGGTIDAMPLKERIKSIVNLPKFLDKKYPVKDANGKQTNKTSPHSTYGCVVNCGNEPASSPRQGDTSNHSTDQEKKEGP